uniref:rRNA adenine N(6)-methyltransferase n=1 Tax=Glossina brevipalpis TaxID=37001 RepID=A0A1A9VZA8_9MUSC
MFKSNKLFSFVTKRLKLYCGYVNFSELKTRKERKKFYGGLFPEKMLNKKLNLPVHMYLANGETAKFIDEKLDPFLKQSRCDTILEINPGIGLLTRKLLDREEQFKKIMLIETLSYFAETLQEMHNLYPDRVKFKQGDIINLRKLAYMDKIDNGSRVIELLSDVPYKQYNDESNMILFGAVGCIQFFKHLINSVTFDNSLLSLGRAEMYLVMPPPMYLVNLIERLNFAVLFTFILLLVQHLTCSNDVSYLVYRATSILFQILFEYRFIAYLPRDSFLPLQSQKNNKQNRLKNIRCAHPEYLYLARIVPRRNLHELCPLEDLPALWYFVRQSCLSRRNRVIPNLEKWVPGCGSRLLISNDKLKSPQQLYPDEDLNNLPEYSSPCKALSTADALPNINIYTEFGDLCPNQMLALFRKFRSWPEYKQSSFLASYDNTMLRIASVSEDVSESLAEEDDITSETFNEMEEELDTKKPPKTKRSKKNIPLV